MSLHLHSLLLHFSLLPPCFLLSVAPLNLLCFPGESWSEPRCWCYTPATSSAASGSSSAQWAPPASSNRTTTAPPWIRSTSLNPDGFTREVSSQIVLKTMGFILKTMDLLLKTMDFILKTMDFLLKTMDFILKTMDFRDRYIYSGRDALPHKLLLGDYSADNRRLWGYLCGFPDGNDLFELC